jgi:hypothetical protein
MYVSSKHSAPRRMQGMPFSPRRTPTVMMMRCSEYFFYLLRVVSAVATAAASS